MSSTIGKLFDWAKPHKKHVYLLNEGSLDERSKAGVYHLMPASTYENLIFCIRLTGSEGR